ncbi:MAG: hypothetical protein OXI88_14150 [Gammaproteobacteria bacterium]|nr:hypothetical protein [Gammaproteobacteria bacterium]
MKSVTIMLAITFVLNVGVSAHETQEAYEYGYIHKHKEGPIGPDNYWHPHMYEQAPPSADVTELRRAFEARQEAAQREHDLYIEMIRQGIEQSRHNEYELELLELILEDSTEY